MADFDRLSDRSQVAVAWPELRRQELIDIGFKDAVGIAYQGIRRLGCYLFDHAAKPLLKEFMTTIETDVIGSDFNKEKNNAVDNRSIIEVNKIIRNHPVEKVGEKLRAAMTEMKAITGESEKSKVKSQKVEPALN